MIGYFLFIVLFVFSKDNHCYEQQNTQCEKIVNTPYDSPDFTPAIEPETFPVTEPDPLPEETLQPNDFETAYLPTLYLEHGILVKAYDIRLSLFPENNTYIQEENNSITIKMKPNNFIFQIYS